MTEKTSDSRDGNSVNQAISFRWILATVAIGASTGCVAGTAESTEVSSQSLRARAEQIDTYLAAYRFELENPDAVIRRDAHLGHEADSDPRVRSALFAMLRELFGSEFVLESTADGTEQVGRFAPTLDRTAAIELIDIVRPSLRAGIVSADPSYVAPAVEALKLLRGRSGGGASERGGCYASDVDTEACTAIALASTVDHVVKLVRPGAASSTRSAQQLIGGCCSGVEHCNTCGKNGCYSDSCCTGLSCTGTCWVKGSTMQRCSGAGE